MRSRDEHLEWCKHVAREYLERGDVAGAVTSMLSDLSKHPETCRVGTVMTGLGLFYADKRDLEGARRFVEGFR